jgi:membrane-bound lytic murein transglycosylase D
MRTGYADFWELYKRNALPQETKNYVPGIIAAIIMAKNPQQYGLEDMVPDAAVVSDTVTVDYSVDLRLVADVTGASLQEIVALNPSLLHSSTPRDEQFDLHVPVGTEALYQKRIKNIPEDKRTSWRFHIARAGESLNSIASSLHGRSTEIATANGLKENAEINAGDELVVPVANVVAAAHTTHYTTRAGDTLVTVADRFNVTVEDLRRWNNLSSSTIAAHRSLIVTEPSHLGSATHARSRGTRASGTKRSVTTPQAGGKMHAEANEHAGIHAKSKSAEGFAKEHSKSASRGAAVKKTAPMKHPVASK